MLITAEWIHKHKTPRGGWTRKQLQAIGVNWPPEKGWIERCRGREISDQQRQTFMAESAARQPQLLMDANS
jgi:hypothetical protein